MRANADLMHVTAYDRIHPHAGVFAQYNIADDLRGVINVAGCRNRGFDAFIGANHLQ
jgi:hypothetical protein